MAKLNRRKTIIGMGLLAAGSGAAFSSAAFQNSVTPDADLQVVVEQNLEIRPGDGLDDDDNVLGNEGDYQDVIGSDEPFGDGDTQPPLAYVDGENGDLDLRVTVPLGSDDVRFEELLEIEGPVHEEVDIGIAYDRFPDDEEENQYGEDITLADGTLEPDIARNAYSFETDGTRISPNNSEAGVGTSETIEQEFDRPANTVSIDPGETVSIDLVVDTDTDLEEIRGAASINPNEFGFQRETVQLIDGFTVGTMTGEDL